MHENITLMESLAEIRKRLLEKDDAQEARRWEDLDKKYNLSDLVKGDSTDDTEKSNYNLNKPIIPIELTMTLDGIGGLVVGNLFRIDYLPELYRKYCYFFISQVGHQIGIGGWTTSITAKMKIDRVKMIKDGLLTKKIDDRPKIKGFSEKLTEAKAKGEQFVKHNGVVYKLSSDVTGTKTLIEIQETQDNLVGQQLSEKQSSYSDKLKDKKNKSNEAAQNNPSQANPNPYIQDPNVGGGPLS